jgi:F1F0 ATPase subunit 2
MTRSLVAALVGAGLGLLASAAFFGGLAVTVERLPAARRPALLVLGSFLLRFAFVAVVLAAVAGWLPPAGLLGAAAGLVLGRQLVVHHHGRRAAPLERRRVTSAGGGRWT